MATVTQVKTAMDMQAFLSNQEFARNVSDIARFTDTSRYQVSNILSHVEFAHMFQRSNYGWWSTANPLRPHATPVKDVPLPVGSSGEPVAIAPLVAETKPAAKYRAATLPLDEEALELAKLAFFGNQPLIDYITKLGWTPRKTFGKLIGLAIGHFELLESK